MKKLSAFPVFVRVMLFVLAGVLVLGALTVVGVRLVNAANEIWACSKDADGSNDEVNQGDMTQMCTDINPINANTFGIKWSWDDLVGPGGNKYFACSLFDTDGDENANNAVCVQIIAASGSGELIEYATKSYTCGDDSPFKCTQPLVETIYPEPDNFCSVYKSNLDPFPGDPTIAMDSPGGAGNAYPYDTTAECSVPNTIVGGTAASLINVCSFTSDSSPNSDPKDCIYETVLEDAFLTIEKVANPDVETVFTFTTSGGLFNQVDTITGSGTTARFKIPAGSYSISEAVPTGWELDGGATCTNRGAPLTVAGTNPISIPVNSNDDIVCTFTNREVADIYPTKSCMGWDSVEHYYEVVTVNSGPGTARGVKIVDTLPETVIYSGYVSQLTTISGTVDQGVCAYDDATRVLTCELNTALPPTTVDTTAKWTVDILVAFKGAGDVWSNSVTASMTTHDLNPGNDTATAVCEPPTSAELLYFKLTRKPTRAILTWETVDESDIIGFNIYRSRTKTGERELIQYMKPAQFALQTMGTIYTYKDLGLNPAKKYFYWLEVVGTYGSETLYGPIKAGATY